MIGLPVSDKSWEAIKMNHFGNHLGKYLLRFPILLIIIMYSPI